MRFNKTCNSILYVPEGPFCDKSGPFLSSALKMSSEGDGSFWECPWVSELPHPALSMGLTWLHIKVPGEIFKCPIPRLHPGLSPIKSQSSGVESRPRYSVSLPDSTVPPRVGTTVLDALPVSCALQT